MAGAEIVQTSINRIELGEKCGSETAAVHIVGAGLPVQSYYKVKKRSARTGKTPKTGLKRSHEHGGRDTLARHVCDCDQKRAISRAAKSVIVIASDGFGRPRCEGHVHSWNVGRDARNQPTLNFARDLNVSLHRDVIAENHDQEHQ